MEEFISAAVQVEKSVRDPRKTEEVNKVSISPPSAGCAQAKPEKNDEIDMNEMKVVVNYVKAQMNQPQRGGGRGNFGRYNGRGRGRTFRRGGGQGRSFNRTGNGNNHDGLECYYCGNRGHISTGCNVRLNKVLLM